MKIIIKGNSIPAYIAAAHNAVERHKEIYGVSHLYHEEIYDVKYRGKRYQIEVTTNKASYIANVLAGHRKLSKVHYGDAA